MPKLTQDRVLGLMALAPGLFVALYWAQADSETGLMERVRGRSSVGDALAPTVAAVLLSLSGIWLMFSGGARQSLTLANVRFLAALIGCMFVSLAIRRWAGPAIVEAITRGGYRLQRDTPPWKYVGFLRGGTTLIWELIFIVERQMHWSRLAMAFCVALFLAPIYDLPFDDLLPPNGDV